MKSSLKDFNCRFEQAEERISEDKRTETKRTLGRNHAHQCTHKGNLRWREEKEAERILAEIMTKNFPSLLKYTNLHIQEVQQTSRV